MAIEQEIFKKIVEFSTIIIHRHQRPDPDAYGSQGGLAEVLQTAFPEKKIYAVGENIHGLKWINQPVEIDPQIYQNALVIVTDTANQPRVDGQLYKQGKFLIKIDHHPNEDPYGDLCWVKADASSCSEMIVDFVNAVEKLQLTAAAAKMLYAGIIGDTGRFMYDATTPHTMRVAAQLMEYDFDQSAVNRKLDDISLPVARLAAYVYQNMQITEHQAAYIVLTREIMEKFALKDAGTAPIVPLPGKIIGVKCWTIIVQQKDHSFRLRIRSKGPIINELAKEYHGGGHPLASGAVMADESGIPAYIKKLDAIAASYTGEEND
ncbi:MAG: bifunctional oligoribonuclease/PAP phosphatase NrnA [Liquorilactobacillus nagelii]|uniref:DHH family phosphoesterase n=1 Tax=Liquorilactobacillus nagelii TaxID=82688 RepID=A0A3Q8CNK1_9LACO|nr:bifunctional oligoribonuclease/PAP phosphatase NrnA [Liquorilactobacillus nagelii]AUJ31617.1 DHH family phosphoesterase [Liquorilactobacillus nagelii]MCC7616020.1 DHH family phosphoesterase [Liquorilactobacillus nagelii]MCI1633182.1 bifunctional oligoribonuclease/PAP phosphatase NrnA [Liquorilactobacillus nagelii]MCI1699616.1 bifunctional oligoribonuclease/PAP phosphatase NrnA [Liquorilactobacillus nagelii]MCP9314327.1 bifunctional oligoribonuclease/PAP phosphatase NrnA [Liquorilactobacillu